MGGWCEKLCAESARIFGSKNKKNGRAPLCPPTSDLIVVYHPNSNSIEPSGILSKYAGDLPDI